MPPATRSALIPLVLTLLRAALAPVVVLLALYRPSPLGFALCLVAALLSDVLDGVVARRLHVATPALRRLDSVVDTLFYGSAVYAVWHLAPAVLRRYAGALATLIALEALRYAFDWLKFRREASYHMWSSKLWGLALFAAFFSVLVLGRPGIAVPAAIYLGILADAEGLLISFVLPTWKSDVPTVFHAYRTRKA